MADISKDILQKIKKDEVRPYPKQYFLLRRSVIWTVFGLSIFLGSIAGAIALFQLRYAEWDLYKHLSHSLIEFVLLVIPFFWLIFLLGFIGFAYYYFRRTEHGYRYATLWIILLSIALSIIGGGLLYSTGLPERLEITSSRVYTSAASFPILNRSARENVSASKTASILSDHAPPRPRQPVCPSAEEGWRDSRSAPKVRGQVAWGQ